VLEVIYLVFNEGYSATAGDDWMRPALCEEALRLGRILAELVPKQPEVHGLVALMEIQASRAGARVGPSGEPILFATVLILVVMIAPAVRGKRGQA
jgi:RNA polymerase sigma-70 factor (ECF subfamily)